MTIEQCQEILNGDLIKIFFAFILTSVIGTWLTWYFQKLAWNHQNEITRRENQTTEAQNVFDELSRLMDRRLYRYRQIMYSFRAKDLSRLDGKMAEYTDLLYEWNDNLNRNYARVEQFFGETMREHLEKDIVKDFIYIGHLLENGYKEKQLVGADWKNIWGKIDHLNAKVYQFDRDITKKIHLRRIGKFN